MRLFATLIIQFKEGTVKERGKKDNRIKEDYRKINYKECEK